MRFLLAFLAYLLLPLMFFAMLWRGFRAPAYWQRFSQRFGHVEFASPESSIWVHAVSVGEVQAAIPLVKRLQHQYPQHKIVVTTQTPTGSERVTKIFGKSVAHSYVPYDVPHVVARFIRHIKPCLVVIMETEIWPNLYSACQRAEVPLIIASARISPRSIDSYQRFRFMFKTTLQQVALIAAQTSRDAERFLRLGAPVEKVKVVGNLKFDFMFVPSNLQQQGEEYRIKYFPNRLIWIAASTHAGEEQSILSVHKKLLIDFPNLILILVPRHPERCYQVLNLIKASGLSYCVRSSEQTPNADTKILLIDTLGELPMFYAASNVAFVGGSLVPIGGHNLLEPAALAIPIIVGPHTFNAPEIAEMLDEVGAAETVSDDSALYSSVLALLQAPDRARLAGQAGKEVIAENYGALDKLMTEISLILTE